MWRLVAVLTAALFTEHADDLLAYFCDDDVPDVATLGTKSFDISSNSGTHAQPYSTRGAQNALHP